MKSKLIFRILGALTSALMIVAVFIPFVSVTGYSQSLWQSHSAVNTLYLPIMIIVFGAIGVLVFSLNIKTELAYSSAGALSFFLIMQTVPIIEQGVFKTLSVGYYCLAIGTILTAVFAFLCGLKLKPKEKQEKVEDVINKDSMINQIDRLYNNESSQSEDMAINQLGIMQPLQATTKVEQQSSNVNNQSISIENSIPLGSAVPSVSSVISEQPVQDMNDLSVEPQVPPVNDAPTIQSIPKVNNALTPQSISVANEISHPTVVAVPKQNDGVSIQNLSEQEVVASQSPIMSAEQSVNPTVAEFGGQLQSVNVNPTVAEFGGQVQPKDVNPVVAEFDGPSNNSMISEQAQSEPIGESIQTLASKPSVDLMAKNYNNGNSNLDIFN